MPKVYVEPSTYGPQSEEDHPPRLIRSERLSRALAGMSFSISLFVLLVLASELLSMAGLYFVNWFTFRLHEGQYLRLKFYQNKPWAKQYWKEALEAEVFDFEPYVAWRKRPYTGQYENVDSDGTRRTTNPECTPSATQIWMFGASSLAGMGGRDEDTIPSILAEKYSKAIGPVCVINFGEGGWVSMQELIQLQLALKSSRKAPDFVLFYDGFADAVAPYYTGRVDVPADFDQLRQKAAQDDRKSSWAFLKATNTYHLVKFFMDQFLKLKKGQTVHTEQQLELYASMAADNYLKNVRLLHSLAEQHGFRYCVLWHPLIFLGNKPLGPYERNVLEAAKHGDPGLVRVCRMVTDLVFSAADSHFVDLTDVFDHTPDESFLDHAHTNPIGNRLIAERVLEATRQAGIAVESTH
jgi:hypothetical protein